MIDIQEKVQEILATVAELDPDTAIVVLTAAMGARAEHDGADVVKVFQRAATIAAIREVKEKMANEQA